MNPPLSYPGRNVIDPYGSSGGFTISSALMRAVSESLQQELSKLVEPGQIRKEIQIAALRRTKLSKAINHVVLQGGYKFETRISPIGKDAGIYRRHRFSIQSEMTREAYPRGLSEQESFRPVPDSLDVYISAVVPSVPDSGAGHESVKGEPLASLLGRVESFAEGEVIVSLLNEKTGDRLEAECDPESLRTAGVSEGDEFRCEVVRTTGGVTVRFVRLEPKHVSEDRIAEIQKGLEDIVI